MNPQPTAPQTPGQFDEQALGALLRTLLRFDSSNPGGSERPVAEWVAGRLTDAGLDPLLVESEHGRASLVTRVSGSEPDRPALLVHGHLDVVPADPTDWTLPPFAGEVHQDCVWGRGAVDMKDMLAMVLAVVDDWHRNGRRPRREIVLCFTADEEAGGALGAGYLVRRHRDLFDGVDEAIGEAGGFSVTLPEGARIYPIQTAERGASWLRLTTRGRAGHGSLAPPDNAVTKLAAVLARLDGHRFPIIVTPENQVLLETISRLRGLQFDPAAPDANLAELGNFGQLIRATLRNTITPTGMRAGDKVNTVPAVAEATVDARFLPGERDALFAVIDEILTAGGATRETLLDHDSLRAPIQAPIVEAMAAALRAEDPAAHPVPYLMSGGTDAKSFTRLGIDCYGFSPLLLPADHDFVAMFHGVDERVPLAALAFGARVLDQFLRTY